MNQRESTISAVERVDAIYRHLPLRAQQEALDFLLLLEQRYGNTHGAEGQSRQDNESMQAAEERKALAILRDAGFIGSLDAEPEYSENYKQELANALKGKHDYR